MILNGKELLQQYERIKQNVDTENCKRKGMIT